LAITDDCKNSGIAFSLGHSVQIGAKLSATIKSMTACAVACEQLLAHGDIFGTKLGCG
jgi:hypothetical protein